MNPSIPLGQLPPISDLLAKHADFLDQRFYNLRLSDFESEESYRKTEAFIKSAVLLHPIVFDRPAILPARKHRKKSWVTKIAGIGKNESVREVSFPFTGSRELFKYAPGHDCGPISASIFLPGNSELTVRFKRTYKDIRSAMVAAYELLQPTFRMIECNNHEVLNWSIKTGKQIELLLNEKYKGYIDLYFPNDLLTLGLDI